MKLRLENTQRLRAAIAELRSARVTVGIQSREGRLEDPEGGATVLKKAVDNEFGVAADSGTGWRVPPRPFMRLTFEEAWRRWSNSLRRRVRGYVRGKISLARVLQRTGLDAKADVQETITTLREPPNAPMTVEQKGSDNPLIDTGQMRQSIRFEATVGGRQVGVG